MRIHYKRTHTQNTYPPAIAAQPEAPPRRRTAALTAHQSTNAPIHQFTHTLHSLPHHRPTAIDSPRAPTTARHTPATGAIMQAVASPAAHEERGRLTDSSVHPSG